MVLAKVAFRPWIGFITPEAVRPNDAHLSLDDPRDLVLQLLAVFAVFLESCRNHDARWHTRIHGFLEKPGTLSAGVVTTTRSGRSGNSATLL